MLRFILFCFAVLSSFIFTALASAAPLTQEQANRISAASNLVLLQGRNKANIEEAINALGPPSHVITDRSEINIIDEGAAVVLSWDHEGCIYSYLTFNKQGRVSGAEALGKNYSSQMKNKTEWLRPSCPDPSVGYESETKRYSKFSCKNAKPHKYCKVANKSGIRNTSVDKKALINSPERKAKVEAQFSNWDGAHRNLERQIKSRMHDPSSYAHVRTSYQDKLDFILVATEFRGKNAFGALILNTARAKVDINGKIIEVLE